MRRLSTKPDCGDRQPGALSYARRAMGRFAAIAGSLARPLENGVWPPLDLIVSIAPQDGEAAFRPVSTTEDRSAIDGAAR